MSVELTEESGDLFTVRIEGIFTFDDLKEAQSKAGAQVDSGRKVKLLILAQQFSGWGKEGDWGDLTFMYEYDSHIERIAIVANEKWVDEMMMFAGAGRREAAVESFYDEEAARDWLGGESE